MTQTETAVNNKEVQNLNTHTAGESEYVLQMKNISNLCLACAYMR